MLMIELCGLPGSGKSTVAVSAIEAMKREGLSVADRNDIYFYRCKNRKKGIATIKMLLKLRHYDLYRKVIAANRKYSKSLTSLRYAMRMLFFFSQLEEAEKDGRFDLALLDEGMVQYVSALADSDAITDSTEMEPILKLLEQKLPRRSVVYCEITPAEAVKRLQGRQAVSKRFNPALGTQELARRLNQRKTSLETVTRHGCELVLDMTRPVPELREQFLQLVRRKLAEG